MGSSAPLGPWILAVHVPQASLRSAWGYSNWAPLGPSPLQSVVVIMNHAFPDLRAAERPNMNNPRRSEATPGDASNTRDIGPSGAELPNTYPLGEQSVTQKLTSAEDL